MGFAPSLSLGIGLGALALGPALAETQPRRLAVVESFTCANLAPRNAVDPEAIHQIARAIALVHNTGSLPDGAQHARLVLRLCFNQSLEQPVIDLVEYSGPKGKVAEASEAAARRSLMRALKAGTLTEPLGALAGGPPENAVLDLVFGPDERAAE